MIKPLWTILMPTVPSRTDMFTPLAEEILRQAGPFGGAVQVQAYLNTAGPGRLGEIRDAMVDKAAARGSVYVSFVDDDDTVSADYVLRIFRALLADQPAHVGFWVGMTRDGVPHRGGKVIHSLGYDRWGVRNDGILFRDFTHIDPILTDVAKLGRFAVEVKGYAEDRSWVEQVRPHLRAKSYRVNLAEMFIDDILYHYRWRPGLSVALPVDDPLSLTCPCHPVRRPALEPSENLYWNPESL